MSNPIEAVACVATTPAQAKVFVATLMAEGIPARIEGENLTDELAASRRLMNLIGTRVMVPTKCVERARELLRPEPIDATELEREALAAEDQREAMPRSPLDQQTTGWGMALLLMVAITAVVVWLA